MCLRKPRPPKGFSLVELLFALAIAMIISAAMASLFAQSVKSRGKTDTDGQRIEGGRYALDVLADDLRHAGFYGDYMPKFGDLRWPSSTLSSQMNWTTPGPCETNLGNLGWSNAVPNNVPVHIMGYEGHPALPADPTGCLPNYLPNTDILVIRRLGTAAYAPADPKATQGDLFMQASNCMGGTDGATKFIVAAKSDSSGSAFNLHNLKCTALTRINRYVVRIYYVASCNICAPASARDATPTLKVAELQYVGGSLRMAGDVEDGAYVPRSVVPGIQDFHVEYGVDTTGGGGSPDGAPDSFKLSNSDPIATPVPGLAWQNVMSVKAYVVTRDLKTTSDYTDGKTYVLGGASIGPFGDHYRRTVFSSSVRLVNPSEAREQ